MSTSQRERLASERYLAIVAGEAFDGADLSSVFLDRLRIDRCSLVAADLRHATLDGCRFRFCDLRRAKLRGASLRYASLTGCDLREADLRDCDLTGARFGFVNTGAANGLTDLTGASMDGATLTGTAFDRVTGISEIFHGTVPRCLSSFHRRRPRPSRPGRRRSSSAPSRCPSSRRLGPGC